MINELCGLLMASTRPDLVPQLRLALDSSISPTSRARLHAALDGSPAHQLLARQPLLMALARTFMDDGQFVGAGLPPETPPSAAAMMLSHGVAAGLSWGDPVPGEPLIGGHPEHIAVDLVCNLTMNANDDLVGVLDRTLRLWRDYGTIGAAKLGGQKPADLLESITGLEVEDFLALGFALVVHRLNWEPGMPWRLADSFGSDMDEGKKSAFLRYVARNPDEMTQRLLSAPPRSGWDLMAFLETPVLHYPNHDEGEGGLVVIDLAFLLERLTTGLYWVVHDHLRDTLGDGERQRWTQAWGEMVEAMVEDNLRPHAPPVLAGHSGYYTEEDLRVAYPGHKTSDVVIDAGEVLMAIEIVSGRLSTDTVRVGDPDGLRRDLEKLAFKKIRQLDDTAKCLASEPDKLLGYSAPARPIQPVVVAAGGFPMSPVTAAAIKEYCEINGSLTGAQPPAVITLDEVEMLEGLKESHGISMPTVLNDWKTSSLRDMGLRNYLLANFGSDIHDYRPARCGPDSTVLPRTSFPASVSGLQLTLTPIPLRRSGRR